MQTFFRALFLSAAVLSLSVPGFANPADFRIIPSREEAVAFLNQYLANGGSTSTGIPAADPRYPAMESLVKETVDTLREVYPDRLKGLPYPWLASTRANSVDAGVTFDDVAGKSVWVILITQGLLDRAASHPHGVMGILAHEIGHLIFRHEFPGVSEKTEKFYFASSYSEPVGADQPNDPRAGMAGRFWRDWTRALGSYPREEFGGIAYSLSIRKGAYQKLFDLLLQKYASPTPACDEAKTLRTAWVNRINTTYFSDMDQTVNLTEDQQAELRASSAQLAAASEVCVGDRRVPLKQILADVPTDLREILMIPLTQKDYVGFDRETNVLRALRSLVSNKYRQMRGMQSALDIDHVRVYTVEEAADDVSFGFFRKRGWNPLATRKMSMEANSKPETWQSCMKVIRSGEVPGFGVLVDSHHATCFRAYHLMQMAERVGYRYPAL